MSGPRLLADENCGLALVPASRRLERGFPIEPFRREWLGFHDAELLDACLAAGLVLVAHDRRTMANHSTDAIRDRDGHAGIILFRRFVRQNDYGRQARLLVDFWKEAGGWDWRNRLVYLPANTPPATA